MEIQLKQFYKLTRKEKEEHINQLKLIPFKDLKEFQKAIVYNWYQDWTLENWPVPKKNFISMEE